MIAERRTSVRVGPSAMSLAPVAASGIIMLSLMSPFQRGASVPPTSRAARSSDVSRQRANLADDLVASVANRFAREVRKAGRERFGEGTEVLKHPKHGGVLRALRAVLDLYGEPNPGIEQGHAVHPFRADFRKDAAIACLEEDCIEAVAPAEEE